MAILKQRLHRKNSSGSYDTVYLENIATNIKMSETDSTTVATAINNRLPLSGGTLTGNLTGQYIIGTWLKTTEVTDKAGDIATIDSDGWIYKRTPAEIRSDIGAQPAGSYAAASHNHSAANITSGTLAVARGGTGQTSVDTTPTSGSKKMCTSGGIYTAINELKRRFNKIYICLDNDEAGLKDGVHLANKTGFINVVIPQFKGGKDISDLYKVLGNKEQFKKTILSLFK